MRKKPDQIEIKNERVDDQYKMESYLESAQLNEAENEASNNESRDQGSTQIIVTRRRRKRTNPAQYKEIEIRRSRSKLRSRSAPNYRVSNEDKEDGSAKQARRSYFLRENRRLDSYKETLDEEDPNFDSFRDPSSNDEEFDEKSAGFAYGNSFQQFAPSETNMSEADAYAGNDLSDHEYENEEEKEQEEDGNEEVMANNFRSSYVSSYVTSTCPSPTFTDSGDGDLVENNVETSAAKAKKLEYCLVCECSLGPNVNNSICGSGRVCGGCREFFKRSRIDGDRYECTQGNYSCNILVANRTRCRKCRLNKCLRVGMAHTDLKKEKTESSRHSDLVCSICDDQGANIHYGIPACLRCFKFYSTHKRDNGSKLVCLKDENCKITKGLNNKCSKCRYEKFSRKIKFMKANGGKF